MKKLMIILIAGMITLAGCSEPTSIESERNSDGDGAVESDMVTSNENLSIDAQETVDGSDDLLEYDEISGIVIDIGNDRFEILLGTSETVEVDGVEVDMAGFDPYTETIVIVDENTIFELVESDGMSELERWEGSFSDLSIDEAVMIFTQELDGEILARKIVIWVWI